MHEQADGRSDSAVQILGHATEMRINGVPAEKRASRAPVITITRAVGLPPGTGVAIVRRQSGVMFQ